MCELNFHRKTFSIEHDRSDNKIILIGGVGIEKQKCLATCEIIDLNKESSVILGDLN